MRTDEVTSVNMIAIASGNVLLIASIFLVK